MKYEEISTKELKNKLACFKAVLRYEKSYYTIEQIEAIEIELKNRRNILKKKEVCR